MKLLRTKFSGAAIFRATRFPIQEQIFFAKRLSFLLSAGIPLTQSLEIIEGQAARPYTRRLYKAVLKDVEEGQLLSVALSKQANRISAFIIAMISVGERAGTLAATLEYLAHELEKRQALRRKIASALAYPAIIAFATIGVTIVLIVYIFPKITPIFLSLHVSLPLTTRLIIGFSQLLSRFGVWFLLALLFLFFLVAFIRKKFASVRALSDRALLHVPLLGSLVRSYNLANSCRTLSILFTNSVPMVEALTMAARAQRNLQYQRILYTAAHDAGEGIALPHILQNYHRLFPPLCTQLIAIGEQAGNLPAVLQYLSEFYESEVDMHTKNLSTAVEPLLMLSMGLVVGFIAISIISPIYGITGHLTPK